MRRHVQLGGRLAIQEMQDLDLPRRFRTICVPSSSFQLVLDPADASQAMQRFHNHLEPGGALLMSCPSRAGGCAGRSAGRSPIGADYAAAASSQR